MNDKQRAAMQGALLALEDAYRRDEHSAARWVYSEAMDALREALAQQQGEPVAFNEWYEANIKYMNIADFKPWMSEAWDAAIEATKEKAAYLRKEIPLIGSHSEEYENGFWDGLDLYEAAIRSMT